MGRKLKDEFRKRIIPLRGGSISVRSKSQKLCGISCAFLPAGLLGSWEGKELYEWPDFSPLIFIEDLITSERGGERVERGITGSEEE